MSFSTLMFLLIFLPVSFLLFLASPKPAKKAVLLLCSLVFFAWGSPVYVILLLCSIVFNYFTAKLLLQSVESEQPKRTGFTMISGAAVNLLLLGFFKYVGFLLGSFNAIFGTAIPEPSLPTPIGISFFTFSALSFLFDVYRGKVDSVSSFLDVSLYISFFPKLISGPIMQYHEFCSQLGHIGFHRERLSSGARKFLIGLAKKLLLADAIGVRFYALQAQPEQTVLSAWLGMILYSLMLYFDFSGYSDMAIGLAELFGIRIRKNFDYPYCASSITEFWRRWHISLGAWFRDYVYIPLGGSREGRGRTIRNLLLVWLLTGIWHGANWTFVVWGLYYGLLLLLEKFVFAKLVEKLPGALRHILTLLLVGVGWVFFFSPDLGAALRWIGCLFGIGSAGFSNGASWYELGASWLLLLVGAVGCLPIPALIGNNLLKRDAKPIRVAAVAVFALLLALCVAAMVSATYSSFLYFQF